MKKFIAVFSAVMIFCLAFTGCAGKNPVSFSVSLADEAYVSEKIISLEGNKNSVEITFDVPEKGCIKMVAYDNSDYDVWPEEIVRYIVDFKDENGNVLYEKIDITDGILEKCLFDSGKVIAEITFENETKEMSAIALSWAYAPEKDEVVEAGLDKTVTASVNENGESVFSFTAENDGLYSFAPTEACIYEWDCSFKVETVDGKDVSGDLSIHGTEWGSRLAFLPKGDYIITVSEVEVITSLTSKMIGKADGILYESDENTTVPVKFGFTHLTDNERNAKLVTDDSSKYLLIIAIGTQTFYDSVQTADIKITDSQGNVVYEEICEEISKIDISQYSGEYTVTVSSDGCCAVELMTTEE